MLRVIIIDRYCLVFTLRLIVRLTKINFLIARVISRLQILIALQLPQLLLVDYYYPRESRAVAEDAIHRVK